MWCCLRDQLGITDASVDCTGVNSCGAVAPTLDGAPDAAVASTPDGAAADNADAARQLRLPRSKGCCDAGGRGRVARPSALRRPGVAGSADPLSNRAGEDGCRRCCSRRSASANARARSRSQSWTSETVLVSRPSPSITAPRRPEWRGRDSAEERREHLVGLEVAREHDDARDRCGSRPRDGRRAVSETTTIEFGVAVELQHPLWAHDELHHSPCSHSCMQRDAPM